MRSTGTRLEQQVLQLLEQPAIDPLELDRLLVEIFRYQVEHCVAYRRWCDALAVLHETVTGHESIPALPQEAWKLLRISTVPEELVRCCFLSSGTSGGARSRQELPDTTLYDRSLLRTFREGMLHGHPPLPFHALLPSPGEAPHSSLVHMVARAGQELGRGPVRWYVEGNQLRVDALARDLRHVEEPVLLLGPAFAHVHLHEALAHRPLHLPEGSRVMETGGYKGRSRELSREDLYARIQQVLGVPEEAIVGQYGMCETSTQFYDLPGEQPRAKAVPPWARVLVVDPRTCEPVEPGKPGLLQIHDPANLWTCAAILTGDLGVQIARDRFQILGRAPEAPLRGCSLLAEDLHTVP